jgi:hypothetical protein
MKTKIFIWWDNYTETKKELWIREIVHLLYLMYQEEKKVINITLMIDKDDYNKFRSYIILNIRSYWYYLLSIY